MHFLYVRFAPDVHRYVASLVHDDHEAEDITQAVFTKLLTAIGKYRQRDVPFAAWIMRVARNAALDNMRARHETPVEEVRIADASHGQANSQRSKDLRQALERLPEDQRAVLVLRHVVGLTPTEIADTLGRTESSVHGLHHRGRHRLRANLIDLGASPVVASPPAA
jgi:RNA polymerase sigma-70 factor (ECF subfamily)